MEMAASAHCAPSKLKCHVKEKGRRTEKVTKGKMTATCSAPYQSLHKSTLYLTPSNLVVLYSALLEHLNIHLPAVASLHHSYVYIFHAGLSRTSVHSLR